MNLQTHVLTIASYDGNCVKLERKKTAHHWFSYF